MNLDVMAAASFSWDRVMKDPVGIIGANFVAVLCMGLISGAGRGAQQIIQIAGQELARDEPAIFIGLVYGVSVGAQLLNFLVSSLFVAGYTRYALNIARGQPYSLSDIFGGDRMYVNILIVRFLTTLAIGLGMMFCIIPGIIAALGFSQATFLVVDKKMEPIDALKESWRLASPNFANLFLWALLGIGITLLGVMACCIGVYVAIPVLVIGNAFIYLKLTRQPTAQG
jgi:uncharacterized membrane protein